jgi:hypothetical protein
MEDGMEEEERWEDTTSSSVPWATSWSVASGGQCGLFGGGRWRTSRSPSCFRTQVKGQPMKASG